MEPNWQTPRQGEGAARPSVWQEPGEQRAQRPLGSAPKRESPQPRQYSGQYPPMNKPGQFSGQHSPMSMPGQPSGQYPPMEPQRQFSGQYPPAEAQGMPQDSWTGAVRANPFEEPAEAPELLNARSDNLYTRDDRFWDHVEEPEAPAPMAKQPTGRQVKPGPDAHTLRWVLLILAVIAVVGIVVYSAVFQVRTIHVEGASTIPVQEVIRLSGISEGMNTFAIDDDAVERGIESNRYLSFVCVDKQLPDKVVLQVKERVQAATVKYCGILYILDNRGMILEEAVENMEAWDHLVAVEGLHIKNCRVGETIALENVEQMKIYTELMVELKVMSALNDVKELDLTDMDNLFLVSRDGYSVRMGNSEKLHAKLRSMLLTCERLNQDGYQGKGGTIDVSIPVNPTYIPETI